MNVCDPTEPDVSDMGLTHWRRLIPLFDVMGAVLIFGSWIASNTLSQRAQGQAGAHQAIADRVRQYRLYEDFAIRLTEVQSDLNRIGHALEASSAAATSSTPGWTGMTSAQVRELNGFVDSLLQYTADVSSSDEVRTRLESVQQQARALSEEFHAARDDYDRILDERKADSTAASGDTTAGENLQRHIDELWDEYDSAKNVMLSAGDQLLNRAAEESAAAGSAAERFKRFSYLLYTLGTVLMLFGRTVGVNSAKVQQSE